MEPTALVYSSHSRSHLLHHDLIVQRALRGKSNQRVLLLPMSETVVDGDERRRQEREVENFRWYFRQFEPRGLELVPFYWSSQLEKKDVEVLWRLVEESEVVLLGGGVSLHGLQRYKGLGAKFAGDPDKLGKLLRARQQRGLLTVGFSAGADQLMDRLFRGLQGSVEDTVGLGVVHRATATLHHDPSRNEELKQVARAAPETRVFGLPNDSGLLVSQGKLASGESWQIIDFIVDTTWDKPEDTWHIRTRAGAPIEHFYADGRHWGFRLGDRLMRRRSEDGRSDRSWILSGGRLLDYQSQQPVTPGVVEELLAAAGQ